MSFPLTGDPKGTNLHQQIATNRTKTKGHGPHERNVPANNLSKLYQKSPIGGLTDRKLHRKSPMWGLNRQKLHRKSPMWGLNRQASTERR